MLTEFGVPMNTGVNYDGPRDGTNDISYLYAITDTVRSLGMGSVLWTGVKGTTQTSGPGPCENASCAITTLNSDGTVSVTNQSGLDRLQYGWGISNNAGGGGSGGSTHRGPAGLGLEPVPGRAQRGHGQRDACWTSGTATAAPTSSGTTCPTASCRSTGASASTSRGNATAAGTRVEIWDCNGGTNQQWNAQLRRHGRRPRVRALPGRHRCGHREWDGGGDLELQRGRQPGVGPAVSGDLRGLTEWPGDRPGP